MKIEILTVGKIRIYEFYELLENTGLLIVAYNNNFKKK